MHVAKIVRKHVDRQGRPKEYVSHLLRRTYREQGKVRHETLANISMLPEEAITALRAVLAGDHVAVAGEGSRWSGPGRTGMSPRYRSWRVGWGSRACSASRAGCAMSPWRC